MKTIKKIFLAGMLVLATTALFAQDGPPLPNGGGAPNENNDPVGGRASVSGGLIVLLVLGAGYGAKKVYDLKMKQID